MVGKKNSPTGTRTILETPLFPRWGRREGGYEYPGDFVVFIFFLASEEQVPKQFKTGLNWKQIL